MKVRKYLNIQQKRAIKLEKEPEAIKLLVLELSGLDGATFLQKIDDELDPVLEQTMTKAIDDYLINHRPVQYILGHSYFYGYKFIVDESVLIPRPETEELVANVLQQYDELFQGKPVKVVDIGTGSGAIAIALSKEEPKMEVYASDISAEALVTANQNAVNNEANVKFYEGDMVKPFIENKMKFDILVSNPPYIPADEEVEDIVKSNEPNIALFGGKDGMYFFDIILKDAKEVLNFPNFIAFEHSFSKGEQMRALAKKYFPDSEVTLLKDLSGKDRMTIIVNK